MIRTLTLSVVLGLGSVNVFADTSTDSSSQETAISEASTAAAAPTPKSSGVVARAVFTTDVQNREPVDNISDFSNNEQPVYFFTDLRDFTGETLTHRWEFNGQVMAEVAISVEGPRWRAYSQKSMLPEWNGTWTVTVLDGSNNQLQVSTLEVTAPQAAAPTTEPSSPDNTGATPITQ